MACSGLNFSTYSSVLHLFSLKTSSLYVDCQGASRQCCTFAWAYPLLHFARSFRQTLQRCLALACLHERLRYAAFAVGLYVPTLPMARKILFFPLRLLCLHLRVVWLTAQCTFS